MIGVYKITSPKNRIYVGSSINIDKRISQYRRGHSKPQHKLHRSILKYGWENHKFEVLEECSLENLRQREHYYGMLLNVLNPKNLNLTLPKVNSTYNTVSKSVRQKMSISSKRRITKDSLKKLLEGKRKVGWIVSEETKSKIAKTLSKPVIHIETGKTFNSLKEAALAFNIPYGSLTCEMGKSRPQKNPRFKYIDNTKTNNDDKALFDLEL